MSARDTDGVRSGSTVTAAVLESKIAEVEAKTGISEEARTGLVELYRKAMSQLETVAAIQ